MAPFHDFDFSDYWDDSDYSIQNIHEPPSDALVAEVEAELGYKLPASYQPGTHSQVIGLSLWLSWEEYPSAKRHAGQHRLGVVRASCAISRT